MRSDDLGSPDAPDAAFVHDSTADTGRTPRWRGLLPALAIPLLLVLLVGALFAVDRSGPAVAGGAAARFLPADGDAARYVDAEGTVEAVEHARLIGVEGIFTAPDIVASSVLGSVGDAEVTAAQLWRETLTAADGSQYADLYLVDEQGISEVAAWGGPVGFTFEPAMLLMPADAVAGSTWSGSGSAFGDGALNYRSEYRASAPPKTLPTPDGRRLQISPDCLQVDGTLVVAQPDAGPLLDSTTSSIWCPGRGRVLTTGEQNGQPIASAVAAPGAELTDAEPAGEPADAAEDAPAVQAGDVTALDAVAVDPFFGDSVKQGAVTVTPAVMDGGLVLVANDRGDDLQAWRLGDARATLNWTAHPGGVLVAVAAVGDVALAATSDRAVHAYDRLGRRLWSWRGAELALAPPVDAAGAGPVVAARDGRVALLGARNGAEAWSLDLGADTRGAILAVGDVVLVADERGRLNGLAVETGELRWRQEIGVVDAMSASADGTGVYVATFDNAVVRLDPATGESLWEDGVVGMLQSVTATPNGVVVATDEQTVGYAADGTQSWTAAGGVLPIVGKATVEGATLPVRGRTVTLRSPDGEDTAAWELPADATTAEGQVVVDGEDLVLVDSFLRFWRMEGR